VATPVTWSVLLLTEACWLINANIGFTTVIAILQTHIDDLPDLCSCLLCKSGQPSCLSKIEVVCIAAASTLAQAAVSDIAYAKSHKARCTCNNP